jgi:hypothetical protein
MIKYQLICDNAHSFEGWFQNAEAYDKQFALGAIACPVCETTSVKKALMTPSLASPKMRKTPAERAPSTSVPSNTNQQTGMAPIASPSGAPALAKSPEKPSEKTPEKVVEQMAELMSELRQLQRKIRSECRDVGNDFAEEARKMHYGEAEPEGIYGHATEEERSELDDEGIDIVELPLLPLDN